MQRFLCFIVLVTLFAVIGRESLAERPPETTDDADIVVTGRVEKVYARDSRDNKHYIVEILVDRVERGDSVKPDSTLYVSCFQRKKTAPRTPAASGHPAIPKEGAVITAYVKSEDGKNEAIYSNWFATAKPTRP